MEEPGRMDHKELAKRSIFKGKDNIQLRKKTNYLRLKKKFYLSAAATKTGVATVDDFSTGAETST